MKKINQPSRELHPNIIGLDAADGIDELEIPEQSKQSDTTLADSGDDGYKEYCEMTIPNVFEMKLGSNILQSHQLAEVIMNCYKIIISKDNEIKKESYLG